MTNPVERLLFSGDDSLGAFVFKPVDAVDIIFPDHPIQHIRGRSKIDCVKINGVEYLAKHSINPKIEYIYHLMAKSAGINVSPSFYSDDVIYVRRFDRVGNMRMHTQTLAAMLPEALGYRDLLDVCIKLGLGETAVEQCQKIMLFNYYALNDDDNNRNFSFVLTPEGKWSLAPAYDLSFCHNPKRPLGPNMYRLKMDVPFSEIPDRLVDDVRNAVSSFGDLCAKNDVDEDVGCKIEQLIKERFE